MKKILIFAPILLLISTTHHSLSLQTPYQAVVIVPVADLVGQPMKIYYPNKSVDTAYEELPLCGGNLKPERACPRIHQLLFNEVVTILDQQEEEVRICVSNIFYNVAGSAKPQTTYWTLKKNFLPLSQIPKSLYNTPVIPNSIDFKTKDKDQRMQNIITLTLPFYDRITKQTFSAGTRFCQIPSKNQNKLSVLIFDPQSKQVKSAKIPKKLCIMSQKQTKQESITSFVHLLKKWTHNGNSIAYVWGGCSLINTYQTNDFTHVEIPLSPEEKTSCYSRGYTYVPKTGFDCAGLITRAAQICDMPYFFKNTTTIVQNLKTLGTAQRLEIGDLIWIPGHIMVISDIDKNLAIEARTYQQGYGKVQELPLKNIFQGINTYNDLQEAFFKKKPLFRVNNKGIVKEKFSYFKLLKIASIWEGKE